MAESVAGAISDQEFWEHHWARLTLPQKPDHLFKNDRVIASTIRQYVPPAHHDKVALEIGCAPGKWLVFLYQELGYRVDGVEYLASAAELTKENLKVNGIPPDGGTIHTLDFLTWETSAQYDLVVSLGFLEHFSEWRSVLAKHAALVRPGGYLVLGMPSFRGVNYWIQKIIDRDLVHKYLPSHNLAIMNPRFLSDAGIALGLTTIFRKCVGGFEPGLFDVPAIKNPLLRLGVRYLVALCNRGFGTVNRSAVASYILVIYQKAP